MNYWLEKRNLDNELLRDIYEQAQTGYLTFLTQQWENWSSRVRRQVIAWCSEWEVSEQVPGILELRQV